MADSEKVDVEDEPAGMLDTDEITLPPADRGAPLPAPMVHRDSHSPLTRAD